ncbi:MAG: metallophosphoesterase [Alphaproteobacteria bacterium]|nr:metallophosphoesterase [Alphaproteobacteria bacterium]
MDRVVVPRRRRRRWRRALVLLLLVASGLAAWMFAEARRMPVLRETTIDLPGYPEGAKPLRVVLLGDTHMGGPDQSPARLRSIVAAVNALHPDLILLAGDYKGEPKLPGFAYAREAGAAPLGGLKAPLGVIAVLGNHDHWDNAAAWTRLLEAEGITVLRNQAARRGPIVVGGIDDAYSEHADFARTMAAAEALGGPIVLLSHGALPFRQSAGPLPPFLAAHTHCGQIALPFLGPVYLPYKHPIRYACGRYDEPGRTIVVSGGVGTSNLPLRLNAPPDYWLITFRAPARR